MLDNMNKQSLTDVKNVFENRPKQCMPNHK